MTREEALEVIKAYRNRLINSVSNQLDKDIEALEMAIQALSQEPCDDAISREWLMRKATERFYTTNYFNHITAMIEEAPSVTQKSGKWINDKNDMPICSRCGYIPQYDRAIDDYEYSNYCPSCGAKMESEE